MTDSIVLKSKKMFKENLKELMIVNLIFSVIALVLTEIPVLSTFIMPILSVGFIAYYLKLVRGEDREYKEIFSHFKDWRRIFILHILMIIFIVLWTLCLIIPGIIALLNYSLAVYLLVDNKKLNSLELIKKSKNMMDGNKKHLLFIALRIFGYGILIFFAVLLINIAFGISVAMINPGFGFITSNISFTIMLGIAYFFLGIYSSLCYVNFYEKLRLDTVESIKE